MTTKDIIKEIVEEKKFSFDTQTILNELTTRQIATTKSYVTKTLKSLGYQYDSHHKVWVKNDSGDLSTLPESLITYVPKILVFVYNTQTNTLDNRELHILGVFYDKEKAKEHMELQKEFFLRRIETAQKEHPDYKISIALSISDMATHKSEEGFVFATDYLTTIK